MATFKKRHLIYIVVLITACSGGWALRSVSPTPVVTTQTSEQKTTPVSVEGQVFTADIAKTQEEQRQGLSGRSGLEANKAMLFPYDTSGDYCLWMKGMLFSIDMVWLGTDKKVVTIVSEVSPSTYPDQSFCPDQPAQYILEFSAGTANSNEWQTGTQFSF